MRFKFFRALVVSVVFFFGEIKTVLAAPVSTLENDFARKLDQFSKSVGLSSKPTLDQVLLQDQIIGFIKIIISFSGVVLFLYLLYAGYLWMMGPNLGDVERAKKLIRNSIIGLLIIASAYIITIVIGNLILNFNTNPQ